MYHYDLTIILIQKFIQANRFKQKKIPCENLLAFLTVCLKTSLFANNWLIHLGLQIFATLHCCCFFIPFTFCLHLNQNCSEVVVVSAGYVMLVLSARYIHTYLLLIYKYKSSIFQLIWWGGNLRKWVIGPSIQKVSTSSSLAASICTPHELSPYLFFPYKSHNPQTIERSGMHTVL